MFPELPKTKIAALMGKLMDTYGKVTITWNPKDKLPAFPAQVEHVQHPFMVNATVKPESRAGSFNQTLNTSISITLASYDLDCFLLQFE